MIRAQISIKLEIGMKQLLSCSLVLSILLGLPLAFLSSLVLVGMGHMEHTSANFLYLWGIEALAIFFLVSGLGAVYTLITGE